MTANKLLTLARAELGVAESPAGSNCVKYNDAYGAGNGAWCCVFLWWLFRQAGASGLFYGGEKTAWCPTLLAHHKAQAVADYKPGDVIFFNFSGGSGASHVGLCESATAAYVTTIDGNAGSDGAVQRRKRAKKYIVGAYRPAYLTETTVTVPVLKPGATGGHVTTLQTLLTHKGFDTWGIDGSWGPDTDKAFRAWQAAAGLTADGSCGPVSWDKLLGG